MPLKCKGNKRGARFT